jgi:hypothetical protein
MKKFYVLVIALLLSNLSYSQKKQDIFYQKIKGYITDDITGLPLKGANIVIESAQNIGTTSDSTGYFSFVAVTGRQTVAFSYIGYNPQKVNVLITTGQELILKIQLEPQVIVLNQVVVNAHFQKDKSINSLIYASGRSFSTEEAYRYAGTLGDPARMVRSYAGVVPERDDRNDIVIRGNSPSGILWRLDGIEIPNPNHYGGIGLTGNTTTLLNTNMLTNSDFITGAFPAEYSNALSGVFDLKMKKANPDKREFRIQTGWNGFELGAEGPFSKKNDWGTFMSCYRYSFLDLMDKIGINFGILPKYQDFTTKFDIPVSKKMDISFLGLWGTSTIDLDDHDRDKKDIATLYGNHTQTGSDLLLGGLNAKYRFSQKTSITLGLSALKNNIKTKIDTFNLITNASALIWDEKSSESKYSFFSELKSRTSSVNMFKVGVRWDLFDINYNQNGTNDHVYSVITNSKDQLNLLRAYLQDEYYLSKKLKATAGINFQYLFFNNSKALEPRLGIQYNINDNQTIAFSYGNHHQMLPRTVYFIQTTTNMGIEYTNKKLDFMAANHYVLAYNWLLGKNMRLKAETYYQNLYSIPIEQDKNSTFSLLNSGDDFYIPQNDSLVNKGKGKNYGVELTIEKFMSNNYYFMLNGSLFESKYIAADGVWRNTAFNSNFICNGVAGYEWWATNNKAFGSDLKITIAGGKRYIPVNEQASIQSGKIVYDYYHAFENRYNDYFRTDLRVYYKMNYRKFYIEFAIDFQNLTNQKNIFYREFVPATGKYNTYYNMSFFPMYTFKCLF